jgi:hypothetical protein
LAKLLAVERNVRNPACLPTLSPQQILAWADAHRRRVGQWPTQLSGPIVESPDDTWKGIDGALRDGHRGLRPGSSLAQLLAQRRGKRNKKGLPPLTKRKILAWADQHYARTGKWPKINSGLVLEAPGERWDLIDQSLQQGYRGQPGGSSLLQLLVNKRGLRHPLNRPPLTEEQILQWAELYFQRTGTWPKKCKSGPIPEAPGETWSGIETDLRRGTRGLAGGSSLAKLLNQ